MVLVDECSTRFECDEKNEAVRQSRQSCSARGRVLKKGSGIPAVCRSVEREFSHVKIDSVFDEADIRRTFLCLLLQSPVPSRSLHDAPARHEKRGEKEQEIRVLSTL